MANSTFDDSEVFEFGPLDDSEEFEFIAWMEDDGRLEFVSEEARLRNEKRIKNARWVDIDEDPNDPGYLASIERATRWLEDRRRETRGVSIPDAEMLRSLGIATDADVRQQSTETTDADFLGSIGIAGDGLERK